MNRMALLRVVFTTLTLSVSVNLVRAANPAFFPQTLPADVIATDRATLNGIIGLNGKPGRVAFQVKPASARRWVGHTPWQRIPKGQTNVSFTAAASYLVPDTDYLVRTIAFVNGIQRKGSEVGFRTPPFLPVSVTGGAQDIGIHFATLNGTVDTLGSAAEVRFEWGTTTNYGSSISLSLGASEGGVQPVQVVISNLLAKTPYHFRVVATNAGGIGYGADATFTTAALSIAVVTNCTEADLRAAVASAETVQFECDGVITLTSPIDVTSVLTIDSMGRSVTISGGNSNRLFNVGSGGNLRLFGLALVDGVVRGTDGGPFARDGGRAYGGAVLVQQGALTAVNCTFSNNVIVGGSGWVASYFETPGAAPGGIGSGGAICALSSALSLTNCSFLGNWAFGGEGGFHPRVVPHRGPAGLGQGGALYISNSIASVVACAFETNQATAAFISPGESCGLGGAVYAVGGLFQVVQTSFAENAASGKGGGIYNARAVITTADTTFRQNLAVARGMASGAAICQDSGEFYAMRTRFEGNQAFGGDLHLLPGELNVRPGLPAEGGAVAIRGGLSSLSHCYLGGNTANGGAGTAGYMAPALAFPQRAAAGEGIGGALFSTGTASITNCTFAENSAASGPFTNTSLVLGDASVGKGGALANLGGNMTVVFSTIAFNHVYSGTNQTNMPQGGGIFAASNALYIANSILAWNYADGTNAFNVSGSVVDGGNNLSSDMTAGFSGFGSLNNTDPLLGPLGDHGGLTLTFPLLPGSPAIDTANPATAPAADQRGTLRPQGPAPDVGAFER
jgi:hypothetical protein